MKISDFCTTSSFIEFPSCIKSSRQCGYNGTNLESAHEDVVVILIHPTVKLFGRIPGHDTTPFHLPKRTRNELIRCRSRPARHHAPFRNVNREDQWKGFIGIKGAMTRVSRIRVDVSILTKFEVDIGL